MVYRVIKTSLCSRRLYCNCQVHRDLLITLYYYAINFSKTADTSVESNIISILGDSWPCTDDLLRKITNKCSLEYVDLLYYNQHILPEDGHNWWPKHVGNYADCIIINIHTCIYAFWLFLVTYLR